jgi:hypothetical protein
MNMNTKILTLLTVFMLLAPLPVMAANTFTINYNVQVVGFTVEVTAPGETAMNFTGASNSIGLKPNGTSSGTIAWGKLNNTGDTVLSFNISAPVNTGVTLRVANNQGMSGSVIVTDVPANPSGWTNILAGASADIFAEADFAANAVKSSTTVVIGAT